MVRRNLNNLNSKDQNRQVVSRHKMVVVHNNSKRDKIKVLVLMMKEKSLEKMHRMREIVKKVEVILRTKRRREI